MYWQHINAGKHCCYGNQSLYSIQNLKEKEKEKKNGGGQEGNDLWEPKSPLGHKNKPLRTESFSSTKDHSTPSNVLLSHSF